MAFEKHMCANEVCVKHTEQRGGKFRFVGGKWYCDECAASRIVFSDGKNLYEFTTTHLTGEPIHVRGKAHLRDLERKHGVSHHQLNYAEKNWSVNR